MDRATTYPTPIPLKNIQRSLSCLGRLLISMLEVMKGARPFSVCMQRVSFMRTKAATYAMTKIKENKQKRRVIRNASWKMMYMKWRKISLRFAEEGNSSSNSAERNGRRGRKIRGRKWRSPKTSLMSDKKPCSRSISAMISRRCKVKNVWWGH